MESENLTDFERYHNARPLATSRLEGLDIDTESDLFLARAALESLGSSPPFLVSQ